MGFKPIENDRMVAYVHWLLCAITSDAPANVITPADGDRRKALEVVVGAGALIVLWLIWMEVKLMFSSSSCERPHPQFV